MRGADQYREVGHTHTAIQLALASGSTQIGMAYAGFLGPQNSENRMTIETLQREMESDRVFELGCKKAGLRWEQRPRGFNGPSDLNAIKVLFVMAEPAPLTETERQSPKAPVTHVPWLTGLDLLLQEHYWRNNLKMMCEVIWPKDTEACMNKWLAGTSSFWVSLPNGRTTGQIGRQLEDYFVRQYFTRILGLLPNAIVVAAGGKAQARLKRHKIKTVDCWAFTRPACNQNAARISWKKAGVAVRDMLA